MPRFPSELYEREELIKALLARLDYSDESWRTKTTKQLWAIYFKVKHIKPKRKIDDAEFPEMPMLGDPNYKPKFKSENGINYILGDSGEYIEYID